MRKNILICAPPPDKAGGVSNYYRMMRQLLAGKVDFFTVNRKFRTGTKLLMNSIGLLQFIGKLIHRKIGVVLVNPSLGPSAVLRDGIFILVANWICRRRVVVFWRGWDIEFQRKLEKHCCWFFLFRKVYFSASRMLVLSSYIRETVKQWGFSGQVSLMTTMCPDEIFEYPFHEERSGKFRFLFLARIEKAKGIYEAIDAFAVLCKKYPGQLTLTIAGSGREKEAAEKYVESIGCPDVEFPGYLRTQKKYECFDCSHCYLLPSYTEGMPGSLLESMAAGLPALVTPVGGVPDFFRDGEMGFLVQIRDTADLQEKMEYMYLHPEFCRKAGQGNRAFAAHTFKSSVVADILLKELSCE